MTKIIETAKGILSSEIVELISLLTQKGSDVQDLGLRMARIDDRIRNLIDTVRRETCAEIYLGSSHPPTTPANWNSQATTNQDED